MRFNYQARTKEGEVQTGTVEAGSREAAIEILQGHNLVVVFLEEISAVPFYARSLKFLKKVGVRELTIFYRQLSILFEANVSPLDSLNILSKQTRNPFFKDIVFDLEKSVKGGEPLSKAMSKYPKIFSSFYINVIKAGEASGKLHDTLRYLADHAEREYSLNRKVKGALTYPIVILCLFIVVAVLMMIYVVPQLSSMLEEVGQDLPLSTKILIASSKILSDWLWLFILIIIALIVGLIRFVKTERGREIWDNFKIRVPIFKTISKSIYLARLAENLKTLLIGGIPILEALNITASVIGNTIYERIIAEAREKVRKGDSISSAFSNYPREIAPMVTQMIAVGEKTAQMDTILEKLALFYQQDVDRITANITQLIEPLMILVLGGGVAFLVSSILMPIYNIASGL